MIPVLNILPQGSVSSLTGTVTTKSLLVTKGYVPVGGWLPLAETLKSFREALEIVTTNVPLYILLPTWLLNWFPHGRVVVEGFAEMRQYILETADDRRASASQERPNDLLSNLVAAADDSLLNGQGGFSESDLVGELSFILGSSPPDLC